MIYFVEYIYKIKKKHTQTLEVNIWLHKGPNI